MLSYREATTGAKPVDWYQELKACNIYDSKRLNRLTQLAVTWAHCPCGALSNELPREDDGEPLDNQLYELGIQFANDLYAGSLTAALTTWGEIQRRGNALLIDQQQSHAVA